MSLWKMKPIPALLFLFLSIIGSYAAAAAAPGSWKLLQANSGVSAMHMQLLHNDRVIIFDRTNFGKSNISLPDGKCRNNPEDLALKVDCTAHSIKYNVAANTVRPLMVHTDTWCSSGSVDPNGVLVQTGGYHDGDRAVRKISPCDDGSCDWAEVNAALAVRRWYSSNIRPPDGGAIILGGQRQFNNEFYPKTAGSSAINLPFLRETTDPEENNLYPFVHLNVDGNLFIFANNRSILFDYKKNVVVRNYPVTPGGDPRNYPSTGSSVLLPLPASGLEAEVLVCGGAPKGSFNTLQSADKTFIEALATCGRIKITDKSPSWTMETMPFPRAMGDMVLLPTAQVLIINGASYGAAGWENGQNPALSPLLYTPTAAAGSRFQVQQESNTPRLYHSTAALLRDGRVLMGGSNPHVGYDFSGVQFPTEVSLEAFSPDYLSSGYSTLRPKIVTPASPPPELSYGRQFALQFSAGSLSSRVQVTMIAPPFTTHSFFMNQRLLVLNSSKVSTVGTGTPVYQIDMAAPATGFLAPTRYYMVFVGNGGIPS